MSNQNRIPAMKLFMQSRPSYGLSAGYLKSRDANTGSSSSVTSSIPIKTSEKSVSPASTSQFQPVPRSYGFNSGYIRQKNEQLRISSEVTPVVSVSSSSSPAIVPISAPVVAVSTSVTSSLPVRKNYGLSSGYLKSKAETSVSTSKPTTVETLAVKTVEVKVNVNSPVREIAVPVIAKEQEEKEVAVNEDDSSFLFLNNLKYEQQAKKSAALEVEQKSKIVETTENFRSSLVKSMQKKIEAENIIIEELISLQPLISNEIEVFRNRVRQLQQVSSVLETSYRTKEKQISQELELLTQMQQLRDRISERNILSEYNRALGKKQELIQVDQELYNNLAQVISQLSNDVLLCKKKEAVLTEKLSVFPSLSDRNALLKYSWSDIADIQSVFSTAETTKAWSDADIKVQGLIASISSAESRRTTILEEVRTLEAQAIPVSTLSSTSTEQQKTGAVAAESRVAKGSSSSTSLSRLDASVFQSLSLSGGLSLVRVSSSEMRSLVEAKSAKEVAFLAANAVLVVLNSLATLSSR